MQVSKTLHVHGSKATETLEKSWRNKRRKKRKKQLTGQSLKQPEEDFDPEKSTSKESPSHIKTPTNSSSSKNGSSNTLLQ